MRRTMPRANPSKSTDRRQRLFLRGIVILVIAFALSLVPTPYYIIAPGSAVDLSTRVAVEGRRPPSRRFFLTDVTVARASVLLLSWRLWPGVRIVRRDTLAPATESARGYDRLMIDAMGESQNAAAVVAERAAGYGVPEPARHVVIVGFSAASRASRQLAIGDELEHVRGRAIGSLADIQPALRGVEPGTRVSVTRERDGTSATIGVLTGRGPRGDARLGVLVIERIERADLPVPVRFDLGDISGSSGGLMLALEIYASLRPIAAAHGAVAGTGTIELDGRVGRIEGTRQKVIAAERAGVATFLVPRDNYAEVANERGIRVIPVATFHDALGAISARS